MAWAFAGIFRGLWRFRWLEASLWRRRCWKLRAAEADRRRSGRMDGAVYRAGWRTLVRARLAQVMVAPPESKVPCRLMRATSKPTMFGDAEAGAERMRRTLVRTWAPF